MNETQHPRLPEGLIWRETEDGIVVVDPAGGKVRVLNGVGSTIWKQLDQAKSMAEITEHLVAHYEVSAEVAAADLAAFLADLGTRGMVIWADPV